MPLHRTEGESEKEKTKLPLAGKQNHGRNHRSTLAVRPARERHVPSLPDNRDPVEAGPHISGRGRIRGCPQRPPGNGRRGPREQRPEPDRTVRIARSGKRTLHEHPRRKNGRPGFVWRGWTQVPTAMFLLDRLVSSRVGDGKRTLFWRDMWIGG
jgi:hypothetical protein